MSASDDFKSLTPTFIVYVNGTRLSADQEAAVKNIVVISRLDGPSACSICLSDPKRQWTDSETFSEGNGVTVQLGYKDDVAEIFDGEITGSRAEFRRTADGTVVIKCHDVLHRLCKARKTLTFSEMNDSDILSQIVSDAGLSLKADSVGTERKFASQKDQTDFEYLSSMARRYGCRVWAKGQDVMFAKGSEGEEVILEWGKTLLEFDAECDTRRVFTSVEVRGWNGQQAMAVKGTAAASKVSVKVGGDTVGPKLVEKYFGQAVATLTDPSVLDDSEAETLAIDVLTLNSFNLVTAEGKAEGEPKVTAGCTVNIKEAGTKYSGVYTVNSVRHLFDARTGYITAFSLSRNAI